MADALRRLLSRGLLRPLRGPGLRRGYAKVLGIETSCDDTGCAIVDSKGTIIGESLNSQQNIHTEFGGIMPPIARDLHAANIEKVVNEALERGKLSVGDVDAVAATVKPGLPLSLVVGMNFGKALSKKFNKPFVPVHHMEAHALTVRMVHNVEFPFLVLLVSGGHSLLAVARGIDDFLLLGKTLDDAPGEAFDKIARRLKLHNLPEVSGMGGGRAMEFLSRKGNPMAFPIGEPLLQKRDCNFSFAGVKNSARSFIIQEEEKHNVVGDEVLPTLVDMCASVQFCITKHICRRVERGMEFCRRENLLSPNNKTLVVSGGVACNKFIGNALSVVCNHFDYNLLIPPPHLCTDNGVMIAWNGVEKWNLQKDIVLPSELNSVDITPKCPFGHDISDQVTDANIKCDWAPLKTLVASF